jgi:hypothetical protein
MAAGHILLSVMMAIVFECRKVMSDKSAEPEKKLSDEDQARVDAYLKSGYNSVERKPFKPMRMMMFLAIIVTLLTVLSIWIARSSGVY